MVGIVRGVGCLLPLPAISMLLVAEAAAQQTPPPPAPPSQTAPSQQQLQPDRVTITAADDGVRTDIERSSYNIADSINAAIGSIADVLGNVPSVQVDLQGHVTVRGDSKVTIMIDGHPTSQFSGPDGAAVLLGLPAGRFERVEVSTNPSAANSPSGNAIINLVSKKGRANTRSGHVNGSYGDRGMYAAGASGSYTGDKLGVTAALATRRRAQQVSTDDARTITDPGTGATARTRAQIDSKNSNDLPTADLGFTYAATSSDHLNLDLHYAQLINESFTSRREDNLNDPVASTRQINPWDGGYRMFGAYGGYIHKIEGDDQTFSLNIQDEEFDKDSRNHAQFLVGGAPNLASQELDTYRSASISSAKAEYKQPFGSTGKLVAGYQIDFYSGDFTNTVRTGADPASATVDPALSGPFIYSRAINAAYATYQFASGHTTILGGLRIEDAHEEFGGVPGLTSRNDFQVYPSLHADYQLTTKQKLAFSYSRRVARPDPGSLNPGRYIDDNLQFQQGNPFVLPQFNDAYEGSWERKTAGSTYRATLYYRRFDNAFTTIYTPLPDGRQLTTLENLASSANSGLEVLAIGKLTSSLKHNVSLDLYRNEINAPDLGLSQSRTATSASARATLDWQVTADDALQVSSIFRGRSPLPQGYIDASSYINLGYRHKIDDKLSLVFTVTNALENVSNRRVIEAPGISEDSDMRNRQRAISLGFTYLFGAGKNKPAPATFDYGN